MVIAQVPWPGQIGYPILGLLQLLPLAAVALVWMLRRHRLMVPAGITLAALELLLCIDLWRHFDNTFDGMQFGETLRLPGLLHYHAGVDGV
ncbi:MAG: oxidoreductase, partial [Chromatiales bacterium]